MGFGRADAAAKPASMLVVVELAGKTEDEIKDLAAAGIAAGLIDSAGLSAAALGKLIKGRGELSVGLVLANGKSASQKAANGDIDFIVFEPGLPLKVFDGRDLEETGKVIKLEMSGDAGLLRSVNNLYPGVDAVLVDLLMSPLTLENMMACRRVADFSGQPVIARVANTLSTAELSALREAGVRIPEDIALVCIDDFGMGSDLDPFMTVARQPEHEMGCRVTQLLIERILGVYTGAPREIVLPARLIIRRSCGAGQVVGEDARKGDQAPATVGATHAWDDD